MVSLLSIDQPLHFCILIMIAASNLGVDIRIDTMLQRNHGKAPGGYYLQLQFITLPREAVNA